MKGMIFDFNGTLFWDSVLHYKAWKLFSKYIRGKEFSDEEMRIHMFGHTNEDIIKYALGNCPTPEYMQKYAYEKEKLYRDECLKQRDALTLAPGAVNLLNYLKKMNIPIAIATMSEYENVKFFIEIFNLYNWFKDENIIYSDGSIKGKPAPDIFILAANKLNLKPQDCIVAEDSLAGIEAARLAKIGKIYAVASLENRDYYSNIDCVSKIITNFNEVDLSDFN